MSTSRISLLRMDIGQHPLKLFLRISPFEQHEPKRGEGQPEVDRAQPDRAEVLPDFGHRHVLAQVQDQRRAAGAQYAVHLLKRSVRLGKVLERRAACQQVEAFVCEGHRRCIALTEVGLDAGFGGIPVRQLHHWLTSSPVTRYAPPLAISMK